MTHSEGWSHGCSACSETCCSSERHLILSLMYSSSWASNLRELCTYKQSVCRCLPQLNPCIPWKAWSKWIVNQECVQYTMCPSFLADYHNQWDWFIRLWHKILLCCKISIKMISVWPWSARGIPFWPAELPLLASLLQHLLAWLVRLPICTFQSLGLVKNHSPPLSIQQTQLMSTCRTSHSSNSISLQRIALIDSCVCQRSLCWRALYSQLSWCKTL